MIRNMLLPLALLGALPAFAHAQTPPIATAPSPALQQRLDQLPAIINGEGDYDVYFAAGFRDQVPEAKFRELGKQLATAMGRATGLEQVTPTGPTDATIVIGFERGIARGRVSIDPNAPHSVVGLLFTGTEMRDDSAAKLEADFRALPGNAGYGVYRLGGTAPTAIMQLNGDRAAPLGSGFKLWVLAEAARQVKAGKRRWSDVVPIGERSLPGGVIQNWPQGAPITLHTLATQMISISDNTATDTLMTTLGRANVDAMVRASGVTDADATLPLLTTMEAFQLKHPSNAALVADWATLSPDARRKRLADPKLRATPISAGMFGDKPLALQIEWFASPADMARVLDTIRKIGDEQAMAILAVNPGGDASRFAYQGFKGGSEPGVISASYLVRTKSGEWRAVVGNWHQLDAVVDQARFFGLMNRVLAQAATE